MIEGKSKAFTILALATAIGLTLGFALKGGGYQTCHAPKDGPVRCTPG